MSEETARDVAFSWKAQLDGLSGRIAVSGVNSRCAALEDELVQLIAEHPLEDKELVAVLATLKRTIGLYVDRASRAAVLTVLRRLAAAKPQVFAKAVAAVLDPVVEGLQPKKTAHPDAIPSPLAPRFVLLPWITLALAVPVSLAGAKPADLPGDAAWKRLVTLAARLLWGIAPARPGGSDTKAASMSRSAHCEVWRMLRGAPELIQPMLTVLTADADTGEAAVVLVGNIVSTATRLGTADALHAVEAAKDAIIGMIDRVLVNAKTPVSYSSVADLGDFLRGHVGSEFDGRFRASISKMLVRAPECVLPTCLWLLQALGSDSVDVSAMYLEVFADPLASNMLKSTNASVRGAAVDLLAHLSGTPATVEAATAAAQILIKPMEQGRYTQPEQRVAAYTLLGGVHAGPDNGWASSVVILPALVRMAARETQEEPVAALFAAIGAHFRAIADQLDAAASDTASAAYKQCEAAVREFADAAAKGLALPDRSAVVRHAWVALALGEPLWGWAAAGDRTAHPWMKAHVAPLVQALAKTAEKAAADPLAAPTSMLDAHVGLALALRLGPVLAPEAIDAGRLVALSSGREKSLVLWDKAYHKCTKASEGAWVLRSARMLFAGGCSDPRLGELLIWAICHPASPALETTRAALGVLADMSRTEPARLWQALSPALFAGMTAALNGSEPGCDWPAVISAAAAGVLAAKAPSETVSSLLVAMALACHHPAAVGALGRSSLWISLVQRAGADPAELCCSHLPALKQSVREAMAGEFGGAAFEAATHLIRDLVLIGGGSVAGQLLEFAHRDIDPAVLGSITDEDIAIWRSPAGQLYFDPIQAKEKAAAGRGGGKGNKADAWAEQLQAEVARKKNQAPKLSKLEQELVAKQEAKESAARERVGTAHAGLRRGLALVRAVVGSGAGGVSDVMLDVVRVVVERAIVGGAAASETLAGSDILATVELMAAAADGLPEALRLPVAMGLLRARGLEAVVPAGWRQESMEDLATRVYFRLRMSCEATPLPPAGFNFLLAFMQATADAGGWGRKAKKGIEEHDEYAQLDHASEQLTMVVDLLSFHAHFGYMAEMPRKEMLALMIQLMAAHPMLLAACRASMVKMAGEMEGSDTPLERDVLIGGLGQPDSVVRNACLAALDFADLTEMDYSASVWLNAGGSGTEVVALEENAELAAALWADNSMEVQIGLIADVIPFLKDRSAEIRNCAARAIGNAAETLVAESDDAAGVLDAALAELQGAYRRWHISLEPDYDEFGIVVPGTQHRVDIAEARVAVAEALAHVAPLLATAGQVQGLLEFLVDDGVLGERSEAVRTRMLAAGARAIECHGARWAGDLMPTLERFLAGRDGGTAKHDHIREGVVVLLGRLAQHLPADQAERVATAVDQLIATLATPSEPVQSAVSQCLPPLAKRIGDAKLAAVVEQLMDMTLAGATFPRRRGGAYGLAGVAKGCGLAALKRFAIVDRLREACEDRTTYQRREGGLFAFETLAATMGRLFEPYIIQFAPLLLELFSDPRTDVRDAALETARVIMRHISGHGVKLILPSTLAGLANDQWRTKKGSVEVLGAMAYCAPKQLSVALPAVVPHIIDVLTDTHGQVADAARRALVCFGEVISNPEIQELVPLLLAALDDPTSKTDAALRALLHTAFIHYIDAPSLALVMPILQRGMRTRAATTKRNAAQIMGSMATLTDPKDLAPYLAALVPLVRAVLIDPVPEARATAAKALGSLVQRLKEDSFPSLVADLFAALKGDASGVDRAGAAQGLSEVLAGIGLARLEGLLPEIVANCGSPRAAVREGFMTLLVFLPTTFGEEFQQFLAQVLPLVLAGLADESELVRNAAQRAGRILVATFARSSPEALLPDLLASMQHESWRIRHSSIELLGEFLYRVAGLSDRAAEREREAARALFNAAQDDDDDGGAQSDAGGDDDDEEVVAAAAADEEDALIMGNLREIITQALGAERCRAVLAALYVSRSDVSSMVRQAAFGVWKGIVSHTPRTARECLPAIMEIVLGGLSSEEYDRRTTAARTLGDLVHKLGEAVMSQIVPILETALREQDGAAGSARHGVFVGLSEILSATGRTHIEAYADAMIPLVRRGLCDEDEMVREAAATAFNGLQQTIGPRVIDSVVPPLLNALTQGAGGELDGIRPEHALEALRELMAVRANVVFPVLIPTLTAVPVSAFNARALSSLIQVAGAALGRRLPQILLALFKSFPVHQAAGDAEAEAALRDTVDAIAATAVHDDVALESLMIQLHESVKAGEATDLAASPADASRVAEACLAMGAICRAFGAGSAARGRTPLGAHVVDWLRILIDHLGASAAQVVEASWAALDALCRAVPRDDYDGYVGPISRAVQHATESLPRGQRTLPGFNLAKGVGPLLPIYSQGLLAGSPDTKERAVRGMARLVRFTEPDALRPFATGITGPLIRIVGDRHPPAVKAAILSTLGLLLVQIPALMRPFLPQLQRTFVRGLTEKEDVVRQRAAAALAALIPLQARLDPLVLELTSGVRQAETQGMRNAMMRAVCAVVQAPNAGALAPASIQAIEAAVVGRIDAVEAGDLRWQALRSRAFGGLCGVVDATAAAALVAQHATVDAADSGAAQEAKLYSLAAALAEAPRLFAGSAELQQRVVESVATALPAAGGQTRAALPAIQVAKAALLSREIAPSGSDIIAPLADALVAVVAADSAYAHDSDAQQAALRALKAAAKYRYADVVEPARVAVVQAAMAHVRDRIIPVKLAAERCALYALRLANVPPEGFEGSDAGLASYVDAVGGAASDRGKLVLDYQRRVLNKLADATRELDYASDDEDDPARAAAKDDAASDDDDGDAE